ncbi:uncharacterized protein LOC108088771 [Drosophila ficusphila]|uniref:uncharacterized protein LOC108088771 n=1 Tax=Drosophila ficusphila TaxID=30025 RepID=UPI0007E85A34|nr:uncharacterized protein LOC108088771 [Drosophila ficusphila]
MLVNCKALLAGLILCSACRILSGLKSLNYLLFRRIDTNCNSKYVSRYEAAISPDFTAVNFTLNFRRNITADVWLRAIIGQRVAKTGDSFRDVFTYNVNLCHVMGRVKGNGLINYWLNNILRESNMPRNCPIKRGNYHLRNVRSEMEGVPRFIRSGSIRVASAVYVRDWSNVNLTGTVLYLEIKMQ